ncbi:MAG: glycosyltransferase family 4 protein [Polyangiaceae bacterium]
MRITFLTQWFDPEPGAIRGLPLARELTRQGVEVEVVTGFPNYPGGKVYPGYQIRPWQRETIEGVSILRVPLYPSHDRSAVRRAANFGSFAISSAVLGPTLTRPSDVLYVYHPPPTVGIAAVAFRLAHRVPVVYHVADMWPESVLESGMLGQGVSRAVAGAVLNSYCNWVYSQCAAITVLSPGFKLLLAERGVPGEKVSVVYNWADDDRFHPVVPNAELAAELGMHGRFNLVFAGNMGPLQGLDTVIRAAQRVAHLPEIQIVLIGSGVDESRLKELAVQSGATNIRFVGRRPLDEMPAINALADVLLIHLQDLPFFSATIPSKTQVALASGRPILMAVAGDAADLVRCAGAGIVVPPENPDALASAILELYGMDRSERELLGRQGREYYLREMSLSVGAKRMMGIFSNVVGRRRSAESAVSLRARGA